MVGGSGVMLPQENFENYNPSNTLASIWDGILQNSEGCEVCGRHDFFMDYFQR